MNGNKTKVYALLRDFFCEFLPPLKQNPGYPTLQVLKDYDSVLTFFTESLLCRATSLQNEDVVDFLISRGAKGKANRDTKETPLHLACYRGYFSIAEKLLEVNYHFCFNCFFGKHSQKYIFSHFKNVTELSLKIFRASDLSGWLAISI